VGSPISILSHHKTLRLRHASTLAATLGDEIAVRLLVVFVDAHLLGLVRNRIEGPFSSIVNMRVAS
jgi:hypothetical protein